MRGLCLLLPEGKGGGKAAAPPFRATPSRGPPAPLQAPALPPAAGSHPQGCAAGKPKALPGRPRDPSPHTPRDPGSHAVSVCLSFPPLQADKRAHHNALERKRRDHIKDSFHSLRDSVPSLQGEKASRAQILDKATEYIQYMRRKNHTHQQDIDDLKRQNALLEQQVRALEKARSSAQLQANYPSSDNSLYTNPKGSAISAFDGGSDSSSDSEPEEPQSRKKLRMEAS
ncbi:protein max-like [Oxyura jamaicensis]|nr:protein max-like [Oxyura jamaicensis]